MTQAIGRRVRDALAVPDPSLLARARTAAETGGADAHRRFADQVEAFGAVEVRPPVRPAAWREPVTVAAFNAERLKHPGATRALLDSVGAEAALLCEVDVGMARSGNRHGPRALTGQAGEGSGLRHGSRVPAERTEEGSGILHGSGALAEQAEVGSGHRHSASASPERTGEGYVYGVEFVELGLGDADEIRAHAGERNAAGFHGNAIVSGLRLSDACVIPLEEGGRWFAGYEGAQHRLGGRIAVAARVADAPRPLWLVSVHLESKSDPIDRAAQIRRLVAALESLTSGAAVVIGGDLNTKALAPGEEAQWLDAPERREPLFADLRAAGFDWRAANVAAATQRTGPSGSPQPPFRKLDWILVRGIRADNPRVVPALDGDGHPISDHEMLAVDLRF
jgi:endonuclease/exonuclease/phosphatase family metal-dependent hydrolase